MNNYHEKEQSKYIKDRNKGGPAFLLVGLGLMVTFVPFAIVALGSMKMCKKISEVLKNEQK